MVSTYKRDHHDMSSKDGLLVAEPLSDSTRDPQSQNFTDLKDIVVSVRAQLGDEK